MTWAGLAAVREGFATGTEVHSVMKNGIKKITVFDNTKGVSNKSLL